VTSKLQERVSVKDFGAAGNGVADDTAAIQAAVNAASSAGVCLFVPEGTYAISSTIAFGSTCKGITGSGAGSKLLAVGSAFANYSPLLFFNGSADGVTIKDLKFKVSNTSYPFVQCLQLQGVTGGLLSNLVFEESGYTAVYLAGSQGVTVSDLLITSTGFRAVRVEPVGSTKSNKITIRNVNVAGYCPNMPISIVGGEGHIVTECKVNRYATTNFGISLQGVSNSLVKSNYLVTDTTEGINCEDCTAIRIQDNQVDCLTGHTDMGISIFGRASGISRCIVSGNSVKGTGGAGIGIASTPSTGPATYNFIVGNTITNPNQLNSANPWGGVLLYGGTNCTYNTVQGNKVIDLVGNVTYGAGEWDDTAGTPNNNQLIDNVTGPAPNLIAPHRIIGASSLASDLYPLPLNLPVTAQSGTITSATCTGSYQRRGKFIFITLLVTITNNGTGAGALILGSFPITNFSGTLNGREQNLTGKQVVGVAGTGAFVVRTYDNLYPAATGASITLSGLIVLP
jgi:hypothetical protein